MLNFIRKFADSLKLHDPAGMELNPITLSFLDKGTEELFNTTYINKFLNHIRLSLIIAILFISVFGIFDILLIPEVKWKLWFIRFGFMCPVILFIFIFTLFASFKKYILIALNIGFTLSGIGIVWMVAIIPSPANYTYYSGLILIFIFGYTFIRVRFIGASCAGWTIIIIYEFVDLFFVNTPLSIMINNNFTIISANVIGMFANYLIEYHNRRDFFLSQQLIKANLKEKQRSHELHLLNEMSNSLNKCRTERETHDVISATSRQLFPHESGCMMVINNPGTKLEKVFSWGNSSDETQFVDFDSCLCFQDEKIQSTENYICIPIIIERDKTWGIFHLDFSKHDKSAYSDEEYKHQIESKTALAVRMTDQYGLFITNLRLRITDPMTGLYNRIYIRESLEKEISQFSHCGIMMTDFDDFKNFNQTHGSDAGDMILQKLIDLLKKNMRNQDIICRYGDDEFILIMPEVSLSETGKQTEQLRSEIEGFSMNCNEKILNITASFGVAGFPEHGVNINDVLNATGKALNRAKAGGKNRIVVL